MAFPRGWGSRARLEVGLPLFLLLSQGSPLDRERRGRGMLAAGRCRDRGQMLLSDSKA